MALEGHVTFNSNKIYLVVINQSTEYRKQVRQNNSKKLKKKQHNSQRQMFQISKRF